MPFMTRIPSDLARFGLTVELVAGWATRGSSSFAPAGVTCHWTAGPKNAADKSRPSLGVVTNGRPGLDGPLCNIYLARDGTCVVVAAGRANHAGAGGFRGLVGNSAVYGIEGESGGDGDWTKAQRKAYPLLVAALLSGLGRDASWGHGHHEWAPTRKIDIRDIMPTVRAEAAAILSNPTASAPGDDMPSFEDDLFTEGGRVLRFRDVLYDLWTASNEVRDDQQAITDWLQNATGGDLRLLVAMLREQQQQVAGLQAAFGTLAEAVATGGGASAADLKAAVTDAIRENLVRVQVSVDGPSAA